MLSHEGELARTHIFVYLLREPGSPDVTWQLAPPCRCATRLMSHSRDLAFTIQLRHSFDIGADYSRRLFGIRFGDRIVSWSAVPSKRTATDV